MKKRLLLLILVGLNCTALNSRADDQPAPAAGTKPDATPVAPAAATPAEAPAQPVDLGASPASEDAASGEAVQLITFDDSPLTDVIKTLARQAGINFQFDPKVTSGVGADGKPVVQPSISIRFENVTAMQALEAVLANHNLTLARDPKTKIARVTEKPPAALEPLVTRVIQLKYASPTNLVAVVKPTLSDPRSQVLADSRTSQLVVLAKERELDAVNELVNKLDSATKQVLIEARLFETSKNPRSIRGIDWSGTLEGQGLTFGNGNTRGTVETVTPGKPTQVLAPNGRPITSQPGSSTVTTLTSVLGEGGLSMSTARGFHPGLAFLNADGVKAVLSFLNKDADTEVLATPRTVTLDNQTATLSVTRANPIFKNTAGTQGSPGGSEVTYTNLGTILTVTPRIAANNAISLKVVPEVSRVVDTIRKTVASTVNEADVYAINKIETQVLVPSGNTLVMGGLISDASTKIHSKVPVLGDIPVLGGVFRHESKRRDKSNLIIFVTPTVVQDADFQPTETAFLKTKAPVDPDINAEEAPMDSAKPKKWKKK